MVSAMVLTATVSPLAKLGVASPEAKLGGAPVLAKSDVVPDGVPPAGGAGAPVEAVLAGPRPAAGAAGRVDVLSDGADR
jgi:hypothetical protein